MPVLVDREKTRAQILDLAIGIVASEGLNALTIRRIAQAAGTSRAIVSTYFDNMGDLVTATFQTVADRQASRVAHAEERGASMEECVAALLPLDAAGLLEWRVLIAFHGVAVTDPDLVPIEGARIDGAVVRFERMLCAHHGLKRPNARVRSDAKRIVNNIKGVAMDLSFHPNPDRRPAEKRRIVAEVLAGSDL